MNRGYIRISVEEKGKPSVSLENQEAAIRSYCDNSGLEIYRDVASAGNVHREGYQTLLKDLRRGDTLIIHKLDRLSRSIFDFASLADILRRKKIKFVSLKEQFDTTIPAGEMMMNVLMVFAQFERKQIKARTRDAMAVLRRKNHVISRYIPYGYAQKDRKLVPEPFEQKQIRKMKKWRAEGTSFDTIAELLNTANIATKRNLTWRGYVVRDILMREEQLEKEKREGKE